MSPTSGIPHFRPDVLRSQRVAAGLSCEGLAVLAGVSPETVRRAERGKSQPSARVLKQLAAALGTSVETFAPPPAEATLKELRQLQGVTQRDMAKSIGVTTAMVSRVECGVYGVREPTRWAAAYGVSEERWARTWQTGREARQQRVRDQAGKKRGGTT
ncbi:MULTISPECIES: helix-turn-helix domain-containing protein [unclassified Streptomyces]|uniref:helix-turn-helix domain-containing protein n=1 Tax=unclassified Streptomyces TaxID=2593676 RepID=UPI0035DF23B2